MLEIRKISKIYNTVNFEQKALNKVSIKFRENEFVSILGPSGSGKTTLLNIVGGLDKYTEGDLIINGKSTKKYTDRDWDSYRNHSVGFVFQSYNLIPHQSALSNVELALTLSGVSKEERRRRAIKVLTEVGLKDHIYKKPNQMSGGQMQRIAIARALINDPEILMADEPTGALDSETSVQVMNILKEIAKNRLVIMVTHNSELAEKYSTRIVKLLDGKIIDDTNPFTKEEEEIQHAKTKKTHMSFFTALALSLNNLLTKKTRTLLTAFAGSIGIIGIALILSLSNGFREYIKKVEEDTLSSYPITIERATADTQKMLEAMRNLQDREHLDDGKIHSNDIMVNILNMMANQIAQNNLEAFKEYLDSNKSNIKEYTNDIQYTYNLNLQLYKSDTSKGVVQVNPTTIFESLGMSQQMGGNNMGMFMSGMNIWQELINNQELLKNQYEVLAGAWPKSYNEVVLIVDENNEINDYALYSLGLKDQKELENMLKKIMTGEDIPAPEPTSYTYDDLLSLNFKLLLNTDYYAKENNQWLNKKDNEEYMKRLLAKAEDIKVVGIIKPQEDSLISSNAGGIGYVKDLTEHVINKINNSEIAKAQMANQKINVFTGQEFKDDNSKFDMSSLTLEEQQYLMSLSQEELAELIANYTANATANYDDNIQTLGIVDLNNPMTINIYPKDFTSKEEIIDIISNYNKDMVDQNKDDYVINYTDFVGLLMSSVTTIINTITYVLIAFVAISLVVSSIMIGIITYISVLERTKEIGILRAIGASKKDVSRVFNAETFIIGLTAGAIGIGVTLLLNIPINMIIKHITDIANVSRLPLIGGVSLIIISMLLTVVAGLIPARIASKKDPVEALRTE